MCLRTFNSTELVLLRFQIPPTYVLHCSSELCQP